MSKITLNALEPLATVSNGFQKGERATRLIEIWDGDLLGRQEEAEMLERFLTNRFRTRLAAGEQEAYSLSIDQTYGAGKSWFLKRLQQQLSLTHPTALIDAWSDDTADDPFGALIAGVIEALKERLPETSKTESAIKKLQSAGGKVVLSSGWSIGKEVVKGIAGTLAEKTIGEEGKEGIKEILTELSSEIEALGEMSHSQFIERRKAVYSFRLQLTGLLNELIGDEKGPASYQLPLFVIVDELDRCRPTYAIKLLEEVKHLFSTPGIIFLFGMNSDQLEKSICAAYGTEFDAKSYLKRFINREYKLLSPNKSDYCIYQLKQNRLPIEKFRLPPQLEKTKVVTESESIAMFISEVFEKYGIELRSISQCFDHIQTFCDLWPYSHKIELFYLLRLIINSHITGAFEIDKSIEPQNGAIDGFGWWYRNGQYANSPLKSRVVNVVELTQIYHNLISSDLKNAHKFNSEVLSAQSFVNNAISQEWSNKYGDTIPHKSDLTSLSNYIKILRHVSRLEK